MDVTKVRFSAMDVPAGLRVSASGAVSGTPVAEPGTYRVGLEAKTNLGTATGELTVVVEGESNGNSQPEGSESEPTAETDPESQP